MTKKDYEKIAKVLAKRITVTGEFSRAYQNEVREQVKYVASDLADTFAEDNPKFDRERFLKACGVS